MAKKQISKSIEADSENITPEMKERFKERMRGIVFRMYRSFPFWGILVEHCRLFVVPDSRTICGTAQVNQKGDIFFAASFFDSLTDDQLLFVLAHEVSHVAFEHHSRMMSRKIRTWNISCDYAINPMLKEALGNRGSLDEDFWKMWYIHEKYADMSAEQIYEEIIRSNIEIPDFFVDMFICENPPKDAVMIRDSRSGSMEDKNAWKNAVGVAHARSKMQGYMPAGLERCVQETLNTLVDWREALSQYLRHGVSKIGKNDYCFSPPSKRLVQYGIYYPSMIGCDSPKIAFAVDTSGSMGDEEMGQAIAEIDEIRKQFGCKLYIIECDAAVHEGRWLDSHEPCPTSFKGGGGTSFIPVFDHIKSNNVEIDVLVYLTDGYGSFGDESPDFDTIWVMTTNVEPPFGKAIQIGVGV